MHQSIPTVPITPPPSPLPLPGNRGTFAHVVSPGEVALANFIAARGLGISIPRGDPRAFDTRVIGKDEAFVKDWLVRQGLEKPADVFEGCRTLADFLSLDCTFFCQLAAH